MNVCGSAGIKIVSILKISQFEKMGWGGQYFSKMSVIEKCLNCTMGVGWGFNPNWDSVKFY